MFVRGTHSANIFDESRISEREDNKMNLINTVLDSFVERKLNQPPATGTPANLGERSLLKALIAGAIAGAAGTLAKSAVERLYPPRVEGQPEPPAVLAEKVAGHELAPAEKVVATEAIHWTFGVATGAAYSALTEYYPAASAREGVNFGMTLMALTHETTLPAMGLSAPAADQSRREKTSEIASHVVYGVVTEMVRKMVRKVL